MATPRDNQQEPGRDNLQDDAAPRQSENESSNVSSEENPQSGDQWNNYQTREMSSGNEENYYQNRERGNYTEGQQSDEGGGSLY